MVARYVTLRPRWVLGGCAATVMESISEGKSSGIFDKFGGVIERGTKFAIQYSTPHLLISIPLYCFAHSIHSAILHLNIQGHGRDGMLRFRSHTSIFQQIVLPHLSSTTPVHRAPPVGLAGITGRHSEQQSRNVSSSATCSSEPNTFEEVSYGRKLGWETYTPPASTSTRLRTKEYLGLGDGGHDGTDRWKDGTRAGEQKQEEESYEKTTALALERIIKSHEQALASSSTVRGHMDNGGGGPGSSSPSMKGKGKEAEERLGSRFSLTNRQGKGAENGHLDIERLQPISVNIVDHSIRLDTSVDGERPGTHESARSSQIYTTSNLAPGEQPFPPLIHQLLQARQFRLTTLHVLNTPSLAIDIDLVHRVADYMDRHGGTNAARRIRKGRIPSPEEKSLMTQDGRDEFRSSTSFLPSIPPTSLQHIDDRSPGIVWTRQQRLTTFYNTQLAHLLSSKRPSGLQPPKTFPKPNTTLRQLRQLLTRIHKLEECRGFIPDRVTANIVLGCWVRCALAPQPDGLRVVLTRDKQWRISPRHTATSVGSQEFGAEELRRLFELVSRLFDRAAGLSSSPSASTIPSGSMAKLSNESRMKESRTIDLPDVAQDIEEIVGDPELSYPRHIKPFVKIFQHGFKQRNDRASLQALRDWDNGIRLALTRGRGVRDCLLGIPQDGDRDLS